jgi:hypothetical protein
VAARHSRRWLRWFIPSFSAVAAGVVETEKGRESPCPQKPPCARHGDGCDTTSTRRRRAPVSVPCHSGTVLSSCSWTLYPLPAESAATFVLIGRQVRFPSLNRRLSLCIRQSSSDPAARGNLASLLPSAVLPTARSHSADTHSTVPMILPISQQTRPVLYPVPTASDRRSRLSYLLSLQILCPGSLFQPKTPRTNARLHASFACLILMHSSGLSLAK